MATITSPLYAGQVPPTNATGLNVHVPGSAPSSSGASPLLPVPGTSNAAPTSANPYAAGFGANSGPYAPTNLAGPPVPGAPTTNVGAAAQSPIGGMNMMSPTDLGRMFDGLKKTYGDGMAHEIMNFLTSGAGFNQGAINNMLAALQPGIQRGTESLAEQFSTSGNRFGSGAQIGIADYLSQVQLNEGQLETQMYEQSINNYMNVLMGTAGQAAQNKANSPGILDTIGQILPLAGAGASGITAGMGAAAGGAGGIASILAGLAAV
jgi:hypothetical protein